jgi:hypothetical protein
MGRASNEKQEFWKFALSEQARSGLSVRKFCLREGLSEPSSYLWRKKLAQETESGNGHHEAEGHPVFLPVNVLPSLPSKLAIAEGRIDTANAMPVLQIKLMRRRHEPIHLVGRWLRGVTSGYYQYHAVPGNIAALETFQRELTRSWLHALLHRSQRHRMPWSRFQRIANRWIPSPNILYAYPNERLYAKQPK